MSDESVEDLASHIRTELAEASPQGFQFSDQVFRQDVALERLIERLSHQAEPLMVERALTLALRQENDGWTLLKLLEIVDRMQILAAASALIDFAGRKAEDDRAKFLAGRACEILVKLPLDLATRASANEVCKEPLENARRFRMGAARERALHRPRTLEWLLVATLMLIALLGTIAAWWSLKP